ncbi:MAG: pyridoxamine 5'-phosphate oxidase family protein [Synergistaceae bacterium]|nr:pyridoxamine 5'-phosphate oxidase family protein [Synergistaceae bacterium]
MLFLLAVLFTGGYGASQAADGDREANVKEVCDFLKSCGNYYIATMEGDQPRVRPFGSLGIFEGRLYIQTGKIKDVSKQLAANPKVEICALDKNGTWVRIQAVAVDDPRREPKQLLIDLQPGLEKMYSADDDNTQVLYLKDAIPKF